MRSLLAAATLLAVVPAADATWSIVLVDTRTGEIGIASATCLTNFDLQANSPVVVVGKGAAAAQSFVDVGGTNRTLITARFRQGVDPAIILHELSQTDGDHETRQYGFADVQGRVATFTGSAAGAWAGGSTGSFTYTHGGVTGTIRYAVQGNILTGQPVIDAAAQALRTTPGDLPTRLMAGMQAARLMGGDGRCSCTTGAATACGSPPASFVRSANCAYFIVSRAGDADLGAFTLPTTSTTAAGIGDVTGDSLPELVVPASSTPAGASVLLFRNTTSPGSGMPSFAAPTEHPCVVNPLVALVADFSRDGRADIIVGGGSTATGAAGAITLHRANGDGTLGNRVDLATPRRVTGVALADLDGVNGPDLVYSTTGQVLVRLNDGQGVFGEATVVGSPVSPSSLSVADLNADGKLDIVVGAGFAGLRYYTGRGDGTFNAVTTVTLPAAARGAAVHDFNNDGRPDVAVVMAASGSSVAILRNTGTGFTTAQTLALNAIGSSLVAADVNRDGRMDLACLDSASRLVTMLADASGTFAVTSRTAVPAANGAMVMPDLNRDGLPEAVVSTGTTLVMGNTGGTFLNPTGFAAGRYFMNINIANQPATATDPVIQMQAAFDAMRVSAAGMPDATRSRLALSTGASPVEVGKRLAATVEVRDASGALVTTPLRLIEAALRADGQPNARIDGAVVSLGGGRYRVNVVATAPGQDRLLVIVDDGRGPVTIMPEPVIEVVGPRAPARVW
jgi:uncharacterized Ntn-hydrolase superfamily protein